MWSFFNTQHGANINRPPIYLHNTLGNSKEEFVLPRTPVRMYNCGPTVYDIQHIGNLSAFVFADTVRGMLEYNGAEVRQVINITDVGEPTSDDQDDKMARGLQREGMALTLENMRTLGERYTHLFQDDLRSLNIPVDKITFPRASDYIQADIAMTRALEEKGYAYKTEHGVYFDVTRFSEYGKLGNIKLDEQRTSVRGGDSSKRHPADFALWKNTSDVGWDSPWGLGIPGWHIECSVMARSLLGEQIDIHTGGPEHIAVHHNNEIAQSEAVSGRKPFARFWLHRAWIQLHGDKISKSEGNVIYLSELKEKGFHPLAYRYWLLGAHYRTPMNFTWEALEASQQAFLRLRKLINEIAAPAGGMVPETYQKQFHERINDDLDTPGAIALLWEMIKDKSLTNGHIYAGMIEFDRVLRLGLRKEDPLATALQKKIEGTEVMREELSPEIQKIIEERDHARSEKNWSKADELRTEIERAGYIVNDTPEGSRVLKKD